MTDSKIVQQQDQDPDLIDQCPGHGDVGEVIPTPDEDLPQVGYLDNELAFHGYSLAWMGDVLRAVGLKVAETNGWRSRGHGDFGPALGVLCHHTAGPLAGNMPSLQTLINGRGGSKPLSGPIANLGLGRDGTFYIVAAGRAYHAGAGNWAGVTTGNSRLIGIEAENTGYATGPLADPWPSVQLDAYVQGTAALLKYAGQSADMCVGHREYALPHGRKNDPDFDMAAFRARVASALKRM
jgi:hypothetical protein